MEYEIEFVKGKGIGTKNMDLNKIYIWVNGSTELGIKLFNIGDSSIKLRIGDTEERVCYIGDSTTPFRGTNTDSVLLQLMVDINPLLIGILLTNNLKLIID